MRNNQKKFSLNLVLLVKIYSISLHTVFEAFEIQSKVKQPHCTYYFFRKKSYAFLRTCNSCGTKRYGDDMRTQSQINFVESA